MGDPTCEWCDTEVKRVWGIPPTQRFGERQYGVWVCRSCLNDYWDGIRTRDGDVIDPRFPPPDLTRSEYERAEEASDFSFLQERILDALIRDSPGR